MDSNPCFYKRIRSETCEEMVLRKLQETFTAIKDALVKIEREVTIAKEE